MMNRYSRIENNFPREFLLLQGLGCKWRKCTFCNYYEDTSTSAYETNRPILEQVTGEFGVLDIINSGSAMELDSQTIALIKEVVKRKHIHTLWFEAHYMYRHQLADFAAQFEGVDVKFRCGIESFSPEMRRRWNKGITDDVTAADVARYFKGVCLLCCTDGDNRERILNDIELAKKHFEYFSVNLFCENGTSVHRNEELARWFIIEVLPQIKSIPGIEILVDNTDLGVG
jgi:hypothetical protein